MSGGWNRSSDPRGRSRGAKVRVKTARGRKTSSTRWLQRQLNDPYVAEARRMGYRSRAAFKFIEMEDRFGLLKGVSRVVDLGCAPGGWTQIAAKRIGDRAKIIGIDLLEMEPIPGAECIVMDFLDEGAEDRLMTMLDGKADLVMSDMANYATGHKQTDHIRTMALCEAALDFAIKVLAPGGKFVSKVLRGGSDQDLLDRMKKHFTTVKHAKPPASRAESTEWYVIATGFKAASKD